MARIAESRVSDKREPELDLGWRVWVVTLAAAILPQVPTQLGGGLLPVMGVTLLACVPMGFIGFGASVRVWRALIGASVMALVPLASIGLVDSPLFGPVVTGTVDTASSHRWASAYRLTGAVVRSDLAGETEIVSGDGGNHRSVMRYRATPVVAIGWGTGQPVRVWLVDVHHEPARAYAGGADVTVTRLVGWADDGGRAVRAVARRDGLATVPADVLLVQPVDDPAAVWWTGWLTLSAVAAVAGGVWTLLRRFG